MKFFAHHLGVVEANMVYAPNDHYFFVQNGAPRHIRCHLNQGGRLGIVNGRLVVGKANGIMIPMVNEGVALIRRSNWPSAPEYTQAVMWVPIEDWQAHKWVVNINETFRAVGYDHRINGMYNPSTGNEVVLVSGTLRCILEQYPRGHDELLRGHVRVGDLVTSCKVRWERWAGEWVECNDPRPRR